MRFLLLLVTMLAYPITQTISPYKISTITATGSVNTDVNLDVLYNDLVIGEGAAAAEGVMYAEYGSRKKGKPKKSAVTKRKAVEGVSKKFDNQLTLEYKILMPHGGTTVLNCKIFRNGNIQMTGVKHITQGHTLIDRIIDIIKAAPDTVGKKEILENKNYAVRMIKCDYKIGFNVKRDALFKVMITEYENMSFFEPCIYPAVKIQYMWNIQNSMKDGVCRCNNQCSKKDIATCNGKGDGQEQGRCKKITVAVFRSGCVIITGAQNQQQIDDTYEWMNNIISTNRDFIEKTAVVMPATQGIDEKKKKILLHKSKIISLRPTQVLQ